MDDTDHGTGSIVVGADRSDGARDAVIRAAELASARVAVLHLLHTVPVESDATEPLPWFGELLDAAERAGCARPHAVLLRGAPAAVLTELGADARMLVVAAPTATVTALPVPQPAGAVR